MSFCCGSVWLNALIFLAGCWILIKGSDLFVDSASAIARIWKVPELVIGLTLVSIGTSLPELSTSMYASWKGISDFTFGNIVGSNVCNISLILGIGIIGAGTLSFSPKILKRDAPVMIGVYVLTLLLLFFCRVPGPGHTRLPGLDFRCGLILLAGCVLYTLFLFRSGEENENGECECPENGGEKDCGKCSGWKQGALLILGLVMIFGGSKAMVDTVVWGAEKLGIPTLIISATIVAFGTSVPELAVTIAGIVKKQHDIAIGNIIGSNIFNILLIFGVCALLNPLQLADCGGAGIVSIVSMCISALLLLGFMAMKKTHLVRWNGVVLLAFYLVFLAYNCKDIIKRFL